MNELEKRSYEELIERRGVLSKQLDDENADLDAIDEEVRAINAEIERRKAAEEDRKATEQKRAELRKIVATGAGEPRGRFGAENEQRGKAVTMKELRSSAAYIDAWVNDVKNKDDAYTETRKILSENAPADNVTQTDGIVPVPTYVEEEIQAIFENNRILNRIHKTYFRGNVDVPFEVSATDAQKHVEGDEAIDEEQLIIGSVSLIMDHSIKKWISFSKNVLKLKGEAFMRYLMDEFRNKIEAGLLQEVFDAIDNAPEQSTTSAIGIPVFEASAVTLDLVAQALALITADDAAPTLSMNRGTYAAMRSAQLNANYAVDPFEGLQIDYTSKIKSITEAEDGDTIMVVGDMYAVQANLPDGDAVEFVIDPYTQKKKNIIEILGELMATVAVTQPGKLVKVVYKAPGA